MANTLPVATSVAAAVTKEARMEATKVATKAAALGTMATHAIIKAAPVTTGAKVVTTKVAFLGSIAIWSRI